MNNIVKVPRKETIFPIYLFDKVVISRAAILSFKEEILLKRDKNKSSVRKMLPKEIRDQVRKVWEKREFFGEVEKREIYKINSEDWGLIFVLVDKYNGKGSDEIIVTFIRSRERVAAMIKKEIARREEEERRKQELSIAI